jgi:hypothetical protein
VGLARNSIYKLTFCLFRLILADRPKVFSIGEYFVNSFNVHC